MKIKRIVSVVTILLVLAGAALAQTFRGSLSGRITDQQGAVVGGATIAAANIATGAEAQVASKVDGGYQFVNVTPGSYKVTVTARGFAISTQAVEVTVAGATRADFQLVIGKETTVIEVVASTGVRVETESAELGNVISAKEIGALPSIGANVYDFVQLSAGAVGSNEGRGLGIVIHGERSSAGNYMLDGGENNDTFLAGVGQQVPLDSIQEYRVQTSNFTAEFGRGAGFIANVISKSGSNRWHGSAYEANRNSQFAANTWGNNALGVKRPHFNRNQFGGSLGGPVVKDKFFLFGSAEKRSVRSAVNNIFTVPTSQLLAISAPNTQAIFAAFPIPTTVIPGTTKTDTLIPFSGGAPVTIPAYQNVTRTGPQDAGAGLPGNELLWTARADYNASDKTQYFLRYAYDDLNQFSSVNQAYSAKLDQGALQTAQNWLVNMNHVFTSNLVTEARFTYNRINGPFSAATPSPASPFPSFTVDAHSSLNLPKGLSSFGGPQNIYQISDSLTWIKGNHTIKGGFQYVHLRDNRKFGAYQNAEARFADDQGLVNGILKAYTLALDPQGALPGQLINPPFGPPVFGRHFHYNEPSVFIQDTWKISPRVTLTPGLRWEYFGVLHSTGSDHRLDANFYYGPGSTLVQRIASGNVSRTIDALGANKGNFYQAQHNNFAPRLGLAWDITGGGKTVFRSGVGLFNDRNFGNVLFNAIQNPPNYGSVRLRNLNFPASILTNPYSAFGSTPIPLRNTSLRHLDQNLKTAYSLTWNATLEREQWNTVFGASYVGSSNSRLYTLNNLNRFGSGGLLDPTCVVVGGGPNGGDDFTGCPRLNTGFSSINNRGNLGHSVYHGLDLKAESRGIRKLGLTYAVNYTWSHSIDNNSSFFGDDPVANPTGFGFLDAFNPGRDRGSSDFDARHHFSANFVWDLPLFRSQQSNALGKQILGGWSVSSIFTARTGSPFSIFDSGVPDFTVETTRPILVGAQTGRVALQKDPTNANNFLYIPITPGNDPRKTPYDFFGSGACNPVTGHYTCEPSVNRPGNGIIGRNTFFRPGSWNQNLVLAKSFALHEGISLQVRGEFYNLFNHSNLYVNGGSNDINAGSSFNVISTDVSAGGVCEYVLGTPLPGGTTSCPYAVPGITASRADNRQMVFGAHLTF